HGIGAGDLVDAVVAQLDMVRRAFDANAGAIGDLQVVHQLEALNADIASARDGDEVLPGDAGAVDGDCSIGLERDVPGRGVAGDVEDRLLVVSPGRHVNGGPRR